MTEQKARYTPWDYYYVLLQTSMRKGWGDADREDVLLAFLASKNVSMKEFREFVRSQPAKEN